VTPASQDFSPDVERARTLAARARPAHPSPVGLTNMNPGSLAISSSDDETPSVAYGWAVALGTLYSLLIAIASLPVYAVRVLSENVSPEEARSDDWLVLAALAMFIAAVAFFIGVMTVRLWLVVPAFLVSGVAGASAFWHALVEVSDHGDGKLLAYAIGCGLAGALAVALSAVAAREGPR
jgi:hypothetical protein